MVWSQPAVEHSLLLPGQGRTRQRRCQLTASQGTCPRCPASLASAELGHSRAISSSPRLPTSSWRSHMLPRFRASSSPDGTPGLRPRLFWTTQLSRGSSHRLPPATSQSRYQSASTNLRRAQQCLSQKRDCNASHHPNPERLSLVANCCSAVSPWAQASGMEDSRDGLCSFSEVPFPMHQPWVIQPSQSQGCRDTPSPPHSQNRRRPRKMSNHSQEDSQRSLSSLGSTRAQKTRSSDAELQSRPFRGHFNCNGDRNAQVLHA